jgi:hypothetical protein
MCGHLATDYYYSLQFQIIRCFVSLLHVFLSVLGSNMLNICSNKFQCLAACRHCQPARPQGPLPPDVVR